MEKSIGSLKIPQTDSIQDLAQFWDTHDLTDFEDDLEEVTEPVFERETVVEIRLHAQEVEAVKEIAKSKGMGYSDLIREWILERIHLSCS
jgi:predicted DNA binding CopG/RHH family protein